jgi:hypothetical protein
VSYTYRVYGLVCTSNTPIPGVVCEVNDEFCPDLSLELHTSRPTWSRFSETPTEIRRKLGTASPLDVHCTIGRFENGNYVEIVYSDQTKFEINCSAHRIWGNCPGSLTHEDLCTYLLGPVMGVLLRLRGILCLHASSVTIGGRAAVLCGMSATGKSTTAAALALQGIPVSCEDVTPIKEAGDCFIVESGYPRICLWPDSVKHLLGSDDALPLLTPNWDKRYLPLDGDRANFEPQAKPLGPIYLLTPRAGHADVPRIEEMSRRDALCSLVQNTYINYLLDRDQRAAEFEVLANIVGRVPIRRIIPHTDPARLPNLCDLILKDASSLGPAVQARPSIPLFA